MMTSSMYIIIATGASQVLTFVLYRDASQLKVLQPNKAAISHNTNSVQ